MHTVDTNHAWLQCYSNPNRKGATAAKDKAKTTTTTTKTTEVAIIISSEAPTKILMAKFIKNQKSKITQTLMGISVSGSTNNLYAALALPTGVVPRLNQQSNQE